MVRKQRSLPEEFNGPLEFAGLVVTLDSLEGERVCLQVSATEGPDGVVDVFGALARMPDRPDGRLRFRVGEEAFFYLLEEEIVEIRLTTLEGSFYFRITIELPGVRIAIADPEIQGYAAME